MDTGHLICFWRLILRESTIENYLGRLVKSRDGLYFKWVSPSNSGVPDRIVLLNRQVWFVELKAPGKKPRPLQHRCLVRLSAAGFNTAVVSTKEEADNLVARIFEEAET